MSSDLTNAARRFVLQHGWRARVGDLAHILQVSQETITSWRAKGGLVKLPARLSFDQLFALWNGRSPEESDWPIPGRAGHGRFEWQAPELALLASLVGRLGPADIAQALTRRLRKITGDRTAQRSRNSVLMKINAIGLQTSDVLGGVTPSQAGREIGSLSVIHHAIRRGHLRATPVGRHLVISRAELDAWKAKRVFPPEGWVQLSTLKGPLGIRSDKLSEFARMGHVPRARRCNPFGVSSRSTRHGSWYVDPEVARQLVRDRRAGKPMPWQGQPNPDNLKATYKLWCERKHPEECEACAAIWGRKGAPKTFANYTERYPPLEHGAKRHLTMKWSPGMTVAQVATRARQPRALVSRAIGNGLLRSQQHRGRVFVTKTDCARWIARKCPTGDNQKSWLSMPSAQKQYAFTQDELRRLIAGGKLRSKVGSEGSTRGVVYVLKQQCAELRSSRGYSLREAARRAGVTSGQMRSLLESLQWRDAAGIPQDTLNAAIKRLNSRHGTALPDAARELRMTLEWVRDRIADGTVKVSRSPGDKSRLYLSDPMMERLRAAKRGPLRAVPLDPKLWIPLSEAALEAGVTTSTVIKWANANEVERQPTKAGYRYRMSSVRRRARAYWSTVRFHRAHPPQWLRAA